MNIRKKVNLLSFGTILLWASAFPISKVALQYYSVNALGVLRCSVAAIFLLIMGQVKHIRKPKKQDIPKFLLSGALGFSLYMLTFNTGVQTLTSATSSILIATTPVMTAIASTFLYKEKISPIGWIAIAVEFIGILVLTLWNGVFSVNTGIIWTLLAAVVFCGYNVYQKQLSSRGYETLEITTYSMMAGAFLLFFFLPQGVPQLIKAPIHQVFVILYLGIAPSAIAYLLWGKALSIAEKTSDVTNFMFVTPFLSVIMGFLILKEIPSAGTFVGGAIILVGLLLFQRKK